MNVRSVIAMALALAVPGAGHLYLRRSGRAAVFFSIVVFMFVVGLSIDGGLYTLAASRGAALRLLATYGSMGSGLLYVAGLLTGPHGSVASATFEYGTAFTLTAGLMNLLLVLDCFDIANGRKP
jgi:hypothetical protein